MWRHIGLALILTGAAGCSYIFELPATESPDADDEADAEITDADDSADAATADGP